jgi:hypothetical protein
MESVGWTRRCYWGLRSEEPPKYNERRSKNKALFEAAKHEKAEDEFKFCISCPDDQVKYWVCEVAFLKLAGISTKAIRSDAPDLWRNARKFAVDGEKAGDEKENSLTLRSSPLFSDSIAWIETTIGFYNSGTNPNIPNQSIVTGNDFCPSGDVATGIQIVPHDSIRQLYEEYESYRKVQRYEPDSVAGYGTFRKAFLQLEGEGRVRLLGCKGSFPTCDYCNNCNDLLRNANRKNSPEEMDVIKEAKRAHLMQQENERRTMEYNRNCCRNFDKNGQPMGIFIMPDAMTNNRTKVPKLSYDKGRHGKETKFLTNRVMGVDVVCGLIDTKILFHLDGFVDGGSNLIVEIMRQTLKEVSKMLETYSHVLPRTQYWQMDNCSENKNRVYFFILTIFIQIHSN